MTAPTESVGKTGSVRSGRAAKTRGKLLDATAELLAERGYSRLSTAAVAERAGVAHGTFYVHFSSKEELADEVLAEINVAFRALLAPIIAPYDPAAIPDVMANRYLPPSWVHPFGTDEFGRDLFSRALYGARVSLSIGFLAMIIAKTVGTIYGAVSAYFGGIVDAILMRILDVWIAFPTFYLMLMLVGVFEASLLALVLILGFTAWPGTARFIRGEILSLKNQQFTEAARAIGLPAHQIILKHLIPSALSPVLVTAALAVAGMIGAEAGLSYLGLGIRPPTPSWGNMVSAGKDNLLNAWWVAFFPGGLLTLTLISFSLLADGLRDALDPKALMQKYV